MKRTRERKCPCCKDVFFPDYRNAKTQIYCGKPDCRKASKAASQRQWSKKNPDYFKGPDHVERVRDWRKANPGWGRRRSTGDPLQDHCSRIPLQDQQVIPPLSSPQPVQSSVLQDLWSGQHPVFVGLIAHLTGSLLQDDIAEAARRLEQLGHDVIASTPIAGGYHDPKNPGPSRPHPHSSRTVQLGGPPSGA